MASTMAATLTSTWRGLLELLLPLRCAGCEQHLPGDRAVDAPAIRCVLCPECQSELKPLPWPACALCQVELGRGGSTFDAKRCGSCAGRPSPLEACVAGVAFQGQVEEWIHRFKYPAPGLAALDPNPGAIARALIRDAAGRLAPRVPELVVPVPLHPRRLRARGFNPAALLAREVATLTHARFAPRLLERMRDTPSQTGLRRAARVRNVAQAFRCRAPVHARIWLVDDVVTTGSTVSEAARSLRRAGAHSVIALATSRTPLAPLHHVSPTLEGPTNRQGIAMARLKRSITLKHRANLGEDVGEVELEEGEELTVLQEWESACLCKNAAGLLFDIPKELVDAD